MLKRSLSPYQSGRKIKLLILLTLFPIILFGQSATITLEWDTFSEADYEGALVLPQKAGKVVEVISGKYPKTSNDGKVSSILSGAEFDTNKQVWEIKEFESGIYQFYVTSTFSADEFAEETSQVWSEDTKVTINLKGTVPTVIIPPAEEGLVWHAFNIIGETKEIIKVSEILPHRKTVYGNIMDAVTGKSMKDVTIIVKEKITDEIVTQGKSDSLGNYSFSIPIGHFDIEFIKEGYISYEMPLEMWEAEFPVRIDGHLSSILTKLQHRIVLSWGAEPRDLDAHLIGPNPNSTQPFHISYRNMRVFEKQHFLDRDDTNSYGPETITMNRLDPGIYTYCVHDYSNSSSFNSKRLSYSNTVIRVYRENSLINEIHIPQGESGTMWRVLQIDGNTGEIKILDKMKYESNPDKIQ